MFPSPSLGPPLLSLSESPPLFCGILEVPVTALELALDTAELALDTALDAAELADEADEPPPQPATARASATSAAVRKPNLRVEVI